jgi:hypothetical protein
MNGSAKPRLLAIVVAFWAGLSYCHADVRARGADMPPVVVDFFYQEGCADCERVQQMVLPGLEERYQGFYRGRGPYPGRPSPRRARHRRLSTDRRQQNRTHPTPLRIHAIQSDGPDPAVGVAWGGGVAADRQRTAPRQKRTCFQATDFVSAGPRLLPFCYRLMPPTRQDGS